MLVLQSLATPLMWVLAFLTVGLVLSKCRRGKVCPKAGWWVVLGADTHPRWGLRAETELKGPAYSRLYSGVRAFNGSGAALIAFCGGRGRQEDQSEAEVMKAMAVYMGIPADRILTETRSQNTMENAVFLTDLLPAGQSRRIGLVTSATHMLRAERVFRKQFSQDTIIPVPVNHTYDPLPCSLGIFIPSATALENSTVALHEWIGILWYSLRYR